jgi:hypothetical protein
MHQRGQKSVEIEFDLNLEDVKAFNLFYMNYNPDIKRQWKRGRINNLALMSGSFLFAIAFWMIGGGRLIPVSIFLGLLGVYSLVWHFIAPSYRRKRIDKLVEKSYGSGANSEVGRHKFSVTKEKVMDTTDMGQSSKRWDVIEKIIANDQYLFFLIRGAKAYVIPRRAFADESTFKQFAKQAEFYLQEAVIQPLVRNPQL